MARTIERKAEPKTEQETEQKTERKTESKFEPKIEFVLATIKCAILRIDLVRQELLTAGIALKAGYITPQTALDWGEEVAPGCLGYVPPLSGLGIKRNGGAE